MRRIALALVSLFCAASAHAEFITFEYKGTINALHEISFTTYTGHEVVSSSIIPGGVRVGDDFHGEFTIDTNLPVSGSDDGQAWYDNQWENPPPVRPSSVILDKTGVVLSSMAIAPGITVLHYVGMFDSLGIFPAPSGNTYFLFNFMDYSSTSLYDLSIPSNINLSAWTSAGAIIEWYDRPNDRYLSMNGMLTSLTKVSAVPEPESYAMFLAGLALVSGVAARRKRLA